MKDITKEFLRQGSEFGRRLQLEKWERTRFYEEKLRELYRQKEGTQRVTVRDGSETVECSACTLTEALEIMKCYAAHFRLRVGYSARWQSVMIYMAEAVPASAGGADFSTDYRTDHLR